MNASLGGLFIRTENPLEKGERILTSIFVTNKKDSILVDCRVVWNKKKGDAYGPPGMGVEFIPFVKIFSIIL